MPPAIVTLPCLKAAKEKEEGAGIPQRKSLCSSGRRKRCASAVPYKAQHPLSAFILNIALYALKEGKVGAPGRGNLVDEERNVKENRGLCYCGDNASVPPG